MKKTIIALFMAAAAFAAFSCSVEAPDSPAEDTIRTAVPGTISFRASWDDGSGTRTSIQQNRTSVWWDAQEQIKIFQGNFYGLFTSDNTEAAASAMFEGTMNGEVDEQGVFWAVYPYSSNNYFNSTGERMTIAVSPNQMGKAGSFARNEYPAIARSENGVLHFHAACGGACFTVASEGIRIVEFHTIGGEAIAGYGARFTLDNEGYPVLGNVADPSARVAVSAPDGGTFQPGTNYYAVMLPGTLASGLTVTFYKTDGTCATTAVNRSITVKRGIFGRLNNLDEGLTYAEAQAPNQILYTTTNGQIVEPSNTDGFGGATMVSNVYEDGRGVMTFDAALSEIGSNAFYNCGKLSSVVLPEGLDAIGEYAFMYDSALTSVTFPSSLRTIGYAAFAYCSLESLSLPDQQLRTIDGFAFDGNPFTEITVPASVMLLGNGAFMECGSLTSATVLMNSMSSWGIAIFENCDNLSTFAGPCATADGRAFVVQNEMKAFAPSGLSSYAVPEGVTAIADECFWRRSDLKTISLPESLERIGKYAFQNGGLTSLTIPAGVVEIQECAFQNCSDLNSVEILPLTPPTIGKAAFNLVPATCFYVYESVVEDYRAAWTEYASKIYPFGYVPPTIYPNEGLYTVNNGDYPFQIQLSAMTDNPGGYMLMADWFQGFGALGYQPNLYLTLDLSARTLTCYGQYVSNGNVYDGLFGRGFYYYDSARTQYVAFFGSGADGMDPIVITYDTNGDLTTISSCRYDVFDLSTDEFVETFGALQDGTTISKVNNPDSAPRRAPKVKLEEMHRIK